MRILLTRAWQPKLYVKPFHGIFYYRYTEMPVSMGYTAALLEQDGHQVRILDGFLFNKGDRAISQAIADFRPEVVCLSSGDLPEWNCPIPTDEFLLSAAREIRGTFNGPLVVCGPHVNMAPAQILRALPDAIAVTGEPEFTVRDVVRQLDSRGAYHDPLPGTAIMTNGQPQIMPPAPPIDLNQLPIPAYHLLPLDSYRAVEMEEGEGGMEAAVQLTRGCPYPCTFCYRGIFNKYRQRDLDKMLAEIDTLVDRYQVSKINFADLEFILSKPLADELLDAMIERGYGRKFKWWCQTRVDSVAPELLRKMKEAGCTIVNYGVESGNEQILQDVKKGITKEQIAEAVAATKAAGIKVHLNLTTGFPGDSLTTYEESWRFFKSLEPDFIGAFAFAIPYPHTPLFAMAEQEGRLDTENWTWDQIRANTGLVGNAFARRHIIYVMVLHTLRARLYSFERYFGRGFLLKPRFWRWFRDVAIT